MRGTRVSTEGALALRLELPAALRGLLYLVDAARWAGTVGLGWYHSFSRKCI